MRNNNNVSTSITIDTNHQTTAHEIRPADAVIFLAVFTEAYKYCVNDHLRKIIIFRDYVIYLITYLLDFLLYVFFTHLINGYEAVRNQECKYPRESDWYPGMSKSLLLLQRGKTKVLSKVLLEKKYIVRLIYLYLHQINPRNNRKSDDKDFTQK